MTSRTGIYPGTFDPVTLGHVDIVRRAMHVVDHLVIGVAEDTGKTMHFSREERASLVEQSVASCAPEAIGRISVIPFEGLLVDFAKAQEACLIIRGLRAVSDYEYEFQMACVNNRLAPEIETVFLTASENTHFISSRFVKQVAKLGGDISSMVSPSVMQALK